MTTNLDTLATALYVKTDDLLKDSPQLAPWRPDVGIGPKLGDAELVTLGVHDVARRAFRLRRGHVILSGVHDAPEAVSPT